MYIEDVGLTRMSIDNKIKAFYGINVVERAASLTAMRIATQIPEQDLNKLNMPAPKYSQMHLANSLLLFQQEYGCYDLPVNEI